MVLEAPSPARHDLRKRKDANRAARPLPRKNVGEGGDRRRYRDALRFRDEGAPRKTGWVLVLN